VVAHAAAAPAAVLLALGGRVFRGLTDGPPQDEQGGHDRDLQDDEEEEDRPRHEGADPTS
jgi:hypothetical protein